MTPKSCSTQAKIGAELGAWNVRLAMTWV